MSQLLILTVRFSLAYICAVYLMLPYETYVKTDEELCIGISVLPALYCPVFPSVVWYGKCEFI